MNVPIVLYISVEVLPYDHASHSQLQILEQVDNRSFQAYPAGVMVDGPFNQANFTGKFLHMIVLPRSSHFSSWSFQMYFHYNIQSQDIHTETDTVWILSTLPQTGKKPFPQCFKYAMFSGTDLVAEFVYMECDYFTQTLWLQSFPQCFPYMYPNFQPSQTFQGECNEVICYSVIASTVHDFS